MCTFKNQKKFGKPGKKHLKTSGNPVYIAGNEYQMFFTLKVGDLIDWFENPSFKLT